MNTALNSHRKKTTTKLEVKPYDARKCRVQDFSRLATTTSACRGHESFPIKYNEKQSVCFTDLTQNLSDAAIHEKKYGVCRQAAILQLKSIPWSFIPMLHVRTTTTSTHTRLTELTDLRLRSLLSGGDLNKYPEKITSPLSIFLVDLSGLRKHSYSLTVDFKALESRTSIDHFTS